MNYFSAEHDEIIVKVDGNRATMIGKSRVNAAVNGGGRHTWNLRENLKNIESKGYETERNCCQMKIDTKHRILEEALTLFSESGYTNVFVGQIADAVGIKAPSLYKHFKNKQAIFNAILEEMKMRYEQQAGMLQMNGTDANADAQMFSTISEDELVQMGTGLFLYFLHDDYARRFRKMLR